MNCEEKTQAEAHEARRSDPEVKQVPFDEAQAINAEPHDGVGNVRALTPWRPEDAANFLTQTIRESQRPLTEALAQRGVPTTVVLLGLLTVIIFAGGLFYLIIQLDIKGGAVVPTGVSVEDENVRVVLEAKLKASMALVAELEETLTTVTGERDLARQALTDAAKRLESSLEAGSRQIGELSEQLQAQDVIGARLAKAEEMVRRSVVDQATGRKSVRLLTLQLSAQAKEVEALRAQLKAARELGAINDPLQEADVLVETPTKEKKGELKGVEGNPLAPAIRVDNVLEDQAEEPVRK